MGKLLRQLVSVHILVAGDEQLGAVGLHHFQETAPFVAYPYGGEIFRLCADSEHDLCAVQSRKNAWLIRRAELILKGYCGIKDLEALVCELVVDVVCDNAVGSAAAVIAFLVADENVVRLFLRGKGEYFLLYAVDLLRLTLINAALYRIGAADSLLVILIGDDGIKGSAVTGGNALEGGGVLDILYAEFAEDKSPVSFCIFGVILH